MQLFQIVEVLIDNGADINVQDKLGETCLHRASTQNRIKCLELLLQSNACDPNLVNSEGNTAL